MTLAVLLISFAVASVTVPLGIWLFMRRGWQRPNWRGVSVVFPAGAIALIAAAVSLNAVLLVAALTDVPMDHRLAATTAFVLGVGLLGLLDDLYSSSARGL